MTKIGYVAKNNYFRLDDEETQIVGAELDRIRTKCGGRELVKAIACEAAARDNPLYDYIYKLSGDEAEYQYRLLLSRKLLNEITIHIIDDVTGEDSVVPLAISILEVDDEDEDEEAGTINTYFGGEEARSDEEICSMAARAIVRQIVGYLPRLMGYPDEEWDFIVRDLKIARQKLGLGDYVPDEEDAGQLAMDQQPSE